MKTIIGAAMGTCVHVGGLYHFLKLAGETGYKETLLGPAVAVDRIVEVVKLKKPDIMAISYRLTPEVASSLFEELSMKIKRIDHFNTKMIFGGTPPVAEAARKSKLFDRVFDGTESLEEIRAFLNGTQGESSESRYARDLVSRIGEKYPYPLLRHHFGRPTMEETLKGIREISLSGVLDVISIGTDQNAQEHFFRPGEMDPAQNGAGGVPVRSSSDMTALYEASRCGNFPLMRCYAGTKDLMKWAEMSVKTIHNAWGAIPLCWYSILDGRSDRTLAEAIAENQQVMKWYALRNIPVEVNESHQWSLRDAHDSLAVAMAYLAAYNAKRMGVHHYIAQFMFNTPPGTTPVMDLAKMAAKLDLISGLEDESFSVIREVRAGIAHFSPDPSVAKGQLAASAMVSLSMNPHILHVVGFSEGDHAVYPHELIESCRIVRGVIRNCLEGLPDVWSDKRIKIRKKWLIREAGNILGAVKSLGNTAEDPFIQPVIIEKAIRTGILDTPHFKGSPYLKGAIITGIADGAWYAINPDTGTPVGEKSRLAEIMKKIN